MIQYLGNYIDLSDSMKEESLSLHFSPSKLPLKKRWENNGISADFIAEYVKNFWICHMDLSEDQKEDRINIFNLYINVKYVANELFENAMKFSYIYDEVNKVPSSHATAAGVLLSLSDDRLIFYITHGASKSQSDIYKSFILKLLSSNPSDMYMEAMRNSHKEENVNNSGLGILSMICDYNALLGWKFVYHEDSQFDIVNVTTMVTLPVENY